MDIDQDLLDRVRKLAERESASFRETLNRVITRGLAPAPKAAKAEPFQLPTFDLGIHPEIDIDRITHYMDDLEDEERLRRMRLRENDAGGASR